MTSTHRSLVLGFAASLGAEAFHPFVSSLRASGYVGRFGLITAKCSDEDRSRLASLADLHWDVDDQFDARATHPSLLRLLHWMRRTRRVRRLYPSAFAAAARLTRERNSQRRWDALEFELEGLQSLRYRLYHQFIVERAADADQILICDLRDVLFQGDPFDPPIEGLELFLEDPASKLGTNPFNRSWLHDLYGAAFVRDVSGLTTSCSGTTAGTREAVLDYLTAMSLEIQWRRRPLGSHDQGVHNYLATRGRLANARVIENGTGRVLTMGLMQEVHTDSAGHVLNANGTVPSVLHQYDRHPQLADALLRQSLSAR